MYAEKKQWIDISWPLSPTMTAYKDRRVVQILPTKFFEIDAARESLMTLSSHTGTHIDAPAHFLRDGATAETISLHALIGTCVVLDMTACTSCIARSDLEQHAAVMTEGARILLKTRNSLRAPHDPFDVSFIYLAADAAAYVRDKNVALIGIDYLGIERQQPGHPTHRTLLQQGIVIVEGLRLGAIEQGSYELICLPLLLPGLDGAPARAVIRKV